AHGITRLVRVVTDNGSNYRAKTFVRTVTAHASRHQRTRPYTPRHNGKVERYQRILSEECLYAHAFYSEDERREAIN
ncbi:integrase core domain-containing protein, partial [Brachybacterium sp. AOP25-B2-12]